MHSLGHVCTCGGREANFVVTLSAFGLGKRLLRDGMRSGHEGMSGTRSRRWSKTLSRLHPHRSTVKHRMLNSVSRAEEQRIICGFRFAVSSQITAWNRVAKHSQIQFPFIHRAYHGAFALAEVVWVDCIAPVKWSRCARSTMGHHAGVTKWRVGFSELG